MGISLERGRKSSSGSEHSLSRGHSRSYASPSPTNRSGTAGGRLLDPLEDYSERSRGVTFHMLPEDEEYSGMRRQVKMARSRSGRRSLSTRIRRNAITGLDEAGHETDSNFSGNESGRKRALRGCCGAYGVWHGMARILTCCFCDVCLRKCAGRQDAAMRQAWREKTALCVLIMVSCLALAFLTFGLTTLVCRPPPAIFRYEDIRKARSKPTQRFLLIHGYVYNVPEAYSPYKHTGDASSSFYDVLAGRDATPFFPYAPSCIKAGQIGSLSCSSPLLPGISYCHSTDVLRDLERIGQVTFTWKDIASSSTHLAFNGYVLDISYYLDQVRPKQSSTAYFPFGRQVDEMLREGIGGDASRTLNQLPPMMRRCLLESFGAGTVDIKSVGCILTDVILYVSLVAILAVILLKFCLAVFFTLFISNRIVGKNDSSRQSDSGNQDSLNSHPANQNGSNPCLVTRGRSASLSDLEGASSGPLGSGAKRKASRHSAYSAALQKTFTARTSFDPITTLSNTTTTDEEEVIGGRRRTASMSIDRQLGHRASMDLEAPLQMPFSIRRASLSQLPTRSDSIIQDPLQMKPTPTTIIRDLPLDSANTLFSPLERTIPNLIKEQSNLIPTLTLQNSMNDSAMYTLMVVTCYSEGVDGLKSTLDSLVSTNYPDDHKMLFIVADGLICGAGNSKSTPELLVDLLEIDPWAGYIQGRLWSDDSKDGGNGKRNSTDGKKVVGSKTFEGGDNSADGTNSGTRITPHPMAVNEGEGTKVVPGVDEDWQPPAYSYVAIADGEKRHNMARVYAGHYHTPGHRVAALLIVKCGTAAERHTGKPGNRGKRDSQIILMAFLSKVLFRDRMTPLEYDIFLKMRYLLGITPDRFEAVLMVDADTVVDADALKYLTAVLHRDSSVMGLCGETKIANKFASWVTAIQVFEYFISHHLNKAFESIFGGVTCLPGCFCMYRIKAPKEGQGGQPQHWVPLLASPDIINLYAENVTDTLHKKNLLLLGEDRYLTTLLLKTFPKRKLLFVPAATCHTLVPDVFSVLLSQRRRWINSTVHNLFELVLVNDLCGTFCCSMQFVIFMELVGTLVLPAAIAFTIVLLLSSLWGPVQWIPLLLLVAILGLPALLILFTARSPSYVLFMLIYLISLPIWNFVLPAYAFWHFDDFSWGQTRQVSGEAPAKHENHGAREGTFDHQKITMKYWHEYERQWSSWVK